VASQKREFAFHKVRCTRTVRGRHSLHWVLISGKILAPSRLPTRASSYRKAIGALLSTWHRVSPLPIAGDFSLAAVTRGIVAASSN
jgi:hypothetical protein